MDRRQFMIGSTALLGASNALAASVSQTVYFDPRLRQAREIATRLHGPCRLVAATGPIAEIPAGMVLAGVTTEAVPFCLLHSIRGATLDSRRLDQDLFAWSLKLPA